MADPALELQALIVATLETDVDVTCKVYDRVPEGAAMPYISFGSEDWTPDDSAGDCIDGLVIGVQLDVWTEKENNRVDIKPIMWAVYRALHDVNLDLPTHAVASGRMEVARVIRDNDGLTTHGAMQFLFELEVN